MSPLDAEQRALLARLAMEARHERLGWATAVARASLQLQEAGVPGEVAFAATLAVHKGMPLRVLR